MSFTEKIFNNPGAQLKKYAIRLFWSIFISSIIIYFTVTLVMTINQVGGAVALWILSPLAILAFYGIAWFAAIRTYAFGELVENSTEIKKNTKHIYNHTNKEEKNNGNSDSISNRETNCKFENSNYQRLFTCKSCKNLIEKYPCKHCGFKLDSSFVPMRANISNDNSSIVCPNCQTKQQKDRKRCISCKQEFMNNHSNIPYWCGKCGQEGPYKNTCPLCNSSIKLMNTDYKQ